MRPELECIGFWPLYLWPELKGVFKMSTIGKLSLGLAVVALSLPACNTTPTQEGAAAGAALGAGAGAIIGHQSGKQGEGALIGAGVGAISGALIGDRVDDNRQRRQNRDNQTVVREVDDRRVEGHYETRVVVTESGERYEERVFVPHN